MLGGIIEVNDLSLKLACFWEERGMVRERKLDPILGD